MKINVLNVKNLTKKDEHAIKELVYFKKRYKEFLKKQLTNESK